MSLNPDTPLLFSSPTSPVPVNQVHGFLITDETGEAVVTSSQDIVKDGADVGGEKTIGWFESLSLLVNNITGPGLVTIPLLYQQAGWLSPTLCFLAMMLVSTFSSTMLCEAINLVPGNRGFRGRVELTTLAKLVFPPWLFFLTLTLFVVSLMATIISSVVISAQTMDLALIEVFDRTGGLELYPQPFHWAWAFTPGDELSPFGSKVVLTLGYVIVAAFTIPLGVFNLDDNMKVQVVAFIAMMSIAIVWFVQFYIQGLTFSHVKMFGSDQTQVLGTVLFNYAYVTSTPSWVNEKRKEVQINGVMWTSSVLSTALFIGLGWLGAAAFTFNNDDDILDVLDANSTGIMKIVSRIAVYAFPSIVLLSSIPVFSIVIRYNLLQNKICGKAVSIIFAVFLPWILSVVFYGGTGLIIAINWTSLLVNGFINFSVPLAAYALALRKFGNPSSDAYADLDTAGVNDEGNKARQIPSSVQNYGTADGATNVHADDSGNRHNYHFHALPHSLISRFCCGARTLSRQAFVRISFWSAVLLCVIVTISTLFVIGLDVWMVAHGNDD